MPQFQQYILPLFDKELWHIDNFINSASNQLTYDSVNNWPISWGSKPYELMLLICGPASSGKTYLTKIWQNLSQAFLITKNIDMLNSQELIKRHNAFIIENIESWDEKKLLYCFNLINEHRKYLLITTESPNNNFMLPDLSSRINSVIKLSITQPDDELMRKLIFKHFSDHSVIVTEQVINYLLVNLPRKFDHMINLLKLITHFALAHKRTVTISLIKSALKDQL